MITAPPDPSKMVLTAPQSYFFHMDCKFPLFVGGFGSGKTQTLLARALADYFQYPGAHIGVYCVTYDLIKLNLIPRFLEILTAANLSYNYNKADFTIQVTSTDPVHNVKYGKFIFRSLTNPERIVAYEVFRSHIDELDILSLADATTSWNKILGRNRQRPPTDLGAQQRVAVYSTPEGFGFLYTNWHKSPPSKEYQLTRAASYSNPYLAEDYVDDLRATYPSNLVDAYIEGHFVNLTGSTVYGDFDRFSSDTDTTIRSNEPLLIGMDFNVGKMSAAIAVRRSDQTLEIVDEFFGLIDTPQLIHAIRERYPRNPITCYPDATGKSRGSTNATLSDHRLLKEQGWRLRVDKSNPRIRDRVLSVNRALRDQKVLINTDRCPNLTDCLEQQVWTDAGLPDKQNDHDHLPDSLGYLVHKEFPIVKQNANRVTVATL